MKKIIIILILIQISLFSAQMIGTVNKIYDGDTIQIIDDESKGKFKVRFADIDAPETDKPNKKGQLYGEQSKQYLSSLINDKKVLIKFSSIDIYGRIVGTVYLYKPGLLHSLYNNSINEQMLKAGYAWFYNKYSKNEKYQKIYLQAKKNKIGMWKEQNNIQPWEFRKN